MYALLGATLKHSISPLIHTMIFKELNVDSKYGLLEVEERELSDTVKQGSFNGLNVTIPYKETVLTYMDELSKEALQIGAVNTIEYKNGKIIGHNTDYCGFADLLRVNDIDVKNKNVVVLGTGGSSKTVVSYLLAHKVAKILVVSRNVVHGKNTEVLSFITYKDLHKLELVDILINTTPVGMYPNILTSPVSSDIVAKFATVVDLIYNPYKTQLLKYAEDKCMKNINGLYMLVAQAVYAQEIWHNCKISPIVIQNIERELRRHYE